MRVHDSNRANFYFFCRRRAREKCLMCSFQKGQNGPQHGQNEVLGANCCFNGKMAAKNSGPQRGVRTFGTWGAVFSPLFAHLVSGTRFGAQTEHQLHAKPVLKIADVTLCKTDAENISVLFANVLFRAIF